MCSIAPFASTFHSTLYCSVSDQAKKQEELENLERIRNAIVIHSPYAGRATYLLQALTQLQQSGVNIVQTTSIAELDSLPAQGEYWRKSGIDIAVAAGGDGLVGGVIAHIAESSLPLGILPLGTANDIARSLHIPLNLSQAVEIIAGGKEVEVDIGEAQPAEQAPHLANPVQEGPVLSHVPLQKHGFFAHALTVGLNVEFSRLATNIAIRQRYGRLTYPLAALDVLRNHEALDVDLHFDELAPNMFLRQQSTVTSTMEKEQSSLRCRALQVAVINAPIFGGQWQLAVPGAAMSDQLLDIVVIEDIELRNLATEIAHFFNLKEQHLTPPPTWREHHTIHHPAELTGIPGIHHLQARGVTIKTDADPRDATLDGEVRGQTPMFVRLASERLRVVVA